MAIKIGITGHRTLEDPVMVKRQIAEAIDKILLENNTDSFEAYTCIATGSDTIFAQVASEKEGTLKIIMPFALEEYRKDFLIENDGDIAVFNELSKKNTPIIVTDIIPKNKDTKDDGYLVAGKYVVDNSDVLIAVWDGEKAAGKGGTTEIVNYAKANGKCWLHIKAYRSDISRIFIKKDKQAKKFKLIYEWLWKICLFFSLLAALVLAVSISFPKEENEYRMAAAEIICVMFTLLIILSLKLFNIKKKRIQFRREAERLRILEKFHKANLQTKALDSFKGIDNDVVEIETKYAVPSPPSISFRKSQMNLLELVDEQIIYHSNGRPELNSRIFRFFEKVQPWLLFLFTVAVVLHYLSIPNQVLHISWLPNWPGLLLSLSIPPVYAAIEGYIFFKEYHKIFIDSGKLKSFFTSVKLQIEAIPADTKISDAFSILNEYGFEIMKQMDEENKEWVTLMEIKGPPGPS